MSAGGRNRPRSSAEIRSDIATTRARLAEDIDAVRYKLSPRRLEREALNAIRGVREEASDTISGLTRTTDRRMGDLGQAAVGMVKRHPVTSTLLGLAVAYFAIRNGRRSEETGMSGDIESGTGTSYVYAPTAGSELPPPRR